MNIMLLSDIPPCNNFTAGIVLNLLCGFLLEAGHNVCCFSTELQIVATSAVIPQDKLESMQFERNAMPRENWGNLRPSGLMSFIGNNSTALFRIPGIAKRAAVFAKNNKADLIWNIVQGQTTIRLVRSVAKKAKLPYIIQVWDTPKWWLSSLNFDRFTFYAVMKEFGRAVRDSKCLVAASWAMADWYKKIYSCPKSVPVILGFNPSRVLPNEKTDSDSGKYIIALSGQNYATTELHALIAALESINWAHAGKKIVLKLYGKSFIIDSVYEKYIEKDIERKGWLDQELLLPELAKADILYCPYQFGSEFEDVARYSFPSKLSGYLKIAVPVLFHGPEYSSPYTFLKEYNAAYLCNSLEPKIIADIIINILDDPNKFEYTERAYAAFLKELTLDRMKENFLYSIK